MLEIENISEQEKTRIEELKSIINHELPSILHEDKTLYYRYLKARDFNLIKAEALLRKHLADRKIYIDIVFENYKPPEHMNEYLPFSFLCFDKEGSVVLYADFGNADFKGLLTLYTFEQISHFVVFHLEATIKRMTEQSKKLGKSITKFSVVMNMENLNLFKATFKKGIDSLIKGFALYQDNYPERVKSVYIINASIYFNICYPVVKHILASALIQKIHIFGKDNWKEYLLENINADVLPAFLGGNLTDPDGDPSCKSFVVFGKKIPDELCTKKKNSIINKNGVRKLVVTRFSSSEIMLYIYEEDTRIEWEFETKSKDIGFGLYYKDSSKTDPIIEELIPKQRIDTMLSSEAGIYKCNKVGTYIIVFDNSYSWIFSKELHYRIRLIKPNMITANDN